MQLKRLFKILRWKLVYWGPRRDITLETWNGLLTCDSKDWLIGKYLYVDRSYEADNIERTMDLLRNEGYLTGTANTFLDVGANLGMISIALLKKNHFKRAVAFEPEPNNFRLLLRNVDQNSLKDRILCFPYALSSSPHKGKGEMELSPDNFGDHRIRHSNNRGFFKEERRNIVTVEVKTLDEILDQDAEIDPAEISLIWIDIQGHEGHFFEGARKLLRRSIPVVTEFWPYAIKRSGMSLECYRQTVMDLFTHFYWFHEGSYQKMRISDVDKLFTIYSTPRSGEQLILVREL